ncbi:Tfp pilus assembly protein PilF [Oxalobacteraceae bacterium GrIS 1.11]
MKPAFGLAAILIGAAALARADCVSYVPTQPGGDYTDANNREGLDSVEKFHFSKTVESLAHGQTGSLGSDIAYTLEHFPNHHRALASMAKLGLRDKAPRPVGAHFTVDCYFERAIRFKPDDATVRMLYGSYLLAGGQSDAALVQLREALRGEPDNPTINYNLGLMYAKTKDYAQARVHARKAYEQGFPLPGLKNKLLAAGQWQELAPEAVPVQTPASAPPVE